MSNKQQFYIGSYTRDVGRVAGQHSEGIYLAELDTTTGEISLVGQPTKADNPSFLALHPNGQYLYAAIEVGDYEGQSSGAISAYKIESDGRLTWLNQRASQGADPCHLVVDQSGQYVLATNYSGGSVIVLPIAADGSLNEASDFVQHQGASVNPKRQQEAHAHSVNMSPDNRFAVVADLGMDKVVVYALDLATGKLTLAESASAQTYAGAGPRHFAFHPDGVHAYVINELGLTVTVFDYDSESGTLTETQTIATVPADDPAPNKSTADIHVSASGKFVYGSNRGHHTIVIYRVDEQTGQLTLVGHESTQGETPRNFALNPTGTFLLAANQDTDNIVSYHIDADSGTLNPTGQQIQVPRPVCIMFR